MKLKMLKVFAGVMTLLAAGAASAAPTFAIGDTVALQALSDDFTVEVLPPGGASSPPGASASGTAVFGAGAEFTVKVTGSSEFTIDVDLDNDGTGPFVLFTFAGGTGTDGAFELRLTDLDFSPPARIIDVSQPLDCCNGSGSFVWTMFGDNFINFLGDSGGRGDVSFDGTSRFDITALANVPAPGTLALLGLALGMAGYQRRRSELAR